MCYGFVFKIKVYTCATTCECECLFVSLACTHVAADVFVSVFKTLDSLPGRSSYPMEGQNLERGTGSEGMYEVRIDERHNLRIYVTESGSLK